MPLGHVQQLFVCLPETADAIPTCIVQELALLSCSMPDGLDGPAALPNLRTLELSWSQHTDCNKLLRAAGPSLMHLNLRVSPI